MLGGIFEQAVTATISLGMMLFSSYQGNTPSFDDLRTFQRGNELSIQARLENAFNEDFRQILQSGQEVAIEFTLTLSSGFHTEILSFVHTAGYDPLMETWTLVCEEQNNRSFKIESWQEFKNANSNFSYKGIHYLSAPIEVNLIAALPKMNMGQNNKTFDLMIFWNFHKPDCHGVIR
jgi:hypothetical protein